LFKVEYWLQQSCSRIDGKIPCKYCVTTKCASGLADVNELNVTVLLMAAKT
jgi:hypothetical protein